MPDALQRLDALVSSAEYHSALETAKFLLRRIESSNRFTIQSILDESAHFFSSLKNTSPEVYSALRLHEKHIHEIAYQKETGRKIIID